MLRFIYIVCISICIPFLSWADGSQYASKSALAEGKWVKIEVSETGIYKLSYSDLKKWGFPNPEKVSVHGYGGWPLDENFKKPYIDDLPAIDVWRGADYLLFYGKGTTKWECVDGLFVHTNNPYATSGYYFLTDSSTPGEMETTANVSGASLQITNFDDYKVHERDWVSINKSGRELYGESFEGSTLAQTFPFSFPGITQEEGKVTMRFLSRATSAGEAILKIGTEEVITLVTYINDSSSYTKAMPLDKTGTWKGEKTESVKVNVSYSVPSHKNTYLDYIRMQVKRTLKPYGAYTFFRSLASVNNVSRFLIQGAQANTLIWDVTDAIHPKLMETELNGSELSFTIPAGPLREFVIVQTNDNSFAVPTQAEEVPCQDLHGLSQTDMVIIALPTVKEQAERLAQAHRERDGLSVEVVEPQMIYNEFSSGTPDASAYRRFMKMFYDRATTEEEKPRYLLLFGDGLYDNRGVSSEIKTTYPEGEIHQKMLLTYQSVNSWDIGSYVTDDYFGFLGDNNDEKSGIEYWKQEIGIGRLPIRTVTQARQAVDKIIAYMDNKEMGAWKNNLCFIGDDGSSADEYTTLHMEQADYLAENIIERNHPEFLVNKIYFDAYKKDFSGQTTYPDVRTRIQQLLKSGLLLMNYTGHGDTQSWSDEKILTQTDISQATYTHLPLWVTATCDFTRFDALATSAGEQVFLNKNSGGIGLFTTTRVVFAEYNGPLNQELITHLFQKREDGTRLTLGEVMKETKNNYKYGGGEGLRNRLNFILIGDPAMKLAYPEYRMKVTAVNGSPVSDDAVTFKALEKITIEGEVWDGNGNRATGFNGTLIPTVLDSKVERETLDNNRKDRTFSFTDYPNTLFIGNDKVVNGSFSFSFTVPKDISYSNDFGKMNLYACDEESGIEAQGNFQNFKVGGTSESAEEDKEGPEIRSYYLNDSTFISGDRVNTTPLFVAHVWDKSGVNLSGSSIGHDVVLIIDGSPAYTYTLNSYYKNVVDKEGEGVVIFPIPAMKPGLHTAEFILWDIHNNSSKETFTFEVVEGLKPELTEITATPNPAREQVEFSLRHNRPEAYMTVNIWVYDMTGRRVWQWQEKGSSEVFKSYIVTWDLQDNSGARLRPGVYVYKAAISTDHSKEATDANKLIILTQ
ncbi:hypothetical protein D0T51_10345 [Parabacteroides sp. 52]|uniref:type IX secretion system sortase PorU n=1 Tax=unclassified Parabacteroides TaxID=2649774 RepID=UPI0013D8DD1C|nr:MULTISPECIES: type IX secretion system sortase PorU [unclassified Parabacteroides]MDH6534658.1 hypothetical protein [Parabacteroides sp. PM5-20]NDV56125.1 hypothetical protein [Parabacteroides sp. 52]